MASKSLFGNTGFKTPAEVKDFARAIFAMATEAEKADKFIRLWCDNGEKNNGRPYFQMYVDSWKKQDRWSWLKGKAQEAKARKERKAAEAQVSDEDLSGLLPPESGADDDIPF